jgi:type VI secretion system protein ImpK
MSDNPFSEPEDSDRTILRAPAGKAQRPQPVDTPRSPGMPGMLGMPGLAGQAETLPKVGRSPLAVAAAPLLDLLARVGTGAQTTQVASAEALRESAVRALQAFEAESRAAGVNDEQLRAAHYALCAALDDTVLATPWGQASSWATRSLSSTFHQDVRSGDRFFDLLSGMQKEPGRYLPALEICYFCLALGLRGRYRLDSHGSAELERIREGLYQVLARMNGAWERELSPHWPGVDAPHRGPARSVPLWVFGAVTLALLALGYVLALGWINSKSDVAQQRLVALPPVKQPLIQREAAPVAPAATAAPVAIERLRKFLAPEISAGLLAVEGDAQRLLIRIKGRGMFDSGSADLQPAFVTLLKRVGDALREQPGRVTVLGHSDNQPIRTVRFPSNFQLSAARAQSAMLVASAASGQAERFSSVGRADTEPLASNDTPEGRETNRRIEVVVSLAGGR